MSEDADRPRAGGEIAGAARGLTRLIRFDPQWYEGFDFSAGGFVRSFGAALAGLPFAIIMGAILFRSAGVSQEVLTRGLAATGVGYAVNAVGFPLLAALIARPVGVTQGYVALIVVLNWAGLFLTMLLAAGSLAVLVGAGPLFGLVSLLQIALKVFVVWRAAKETLTGELGVTVLMVVLFVALDFGSDYLGLMLAAPS